MTIYQLRIIERLWGTRKFTVRLLYPPPALDFFLIIPEPFINPLDSSPSSSPTFSQPSSSPQLSSPSSSAPSPSTLSTPYPPAPPPSSSPSSPNTTPPSPPSTNIDSQRPRRRRRPTPTTNPLSSSPTNQSTTSSPPSWRSPPCRDLCWRRAWVGVWGWRGGGTWDRPVGRDGGFLRAGEEGGRRGKGLKG